MKHLLIALFSLTFLVGCGKKDPQPTAPLVPAPKVRAKATPSQPELPTERKSPKPKVTTKSIVKKPGTVLWEFVTGSKVTSSPAIGSDGNVCFGGLNTRKFVAGAWLVNGFIYALDRKTGAKKWGFETGDNITTSPAIGVDGTLYFGSVDKKYYALKTASKDLAKSPNTPAARMPSNPVNRAFILLFSFYLLLPL